VTSLERNAQALIGLVQGEAESRRDARIEAARAQARALLREARSAARRRVRETVVLERRRGHAELAAARAACDTRRRLCEQRRSAALLAVAWAALPDALVARWQRDAERSAWCARALAMARAALPLRDWSIVHPSDWPPAERDAFAADVLRATGQPPSFRADAAARAGIAIAAGNASVDATLAGLVADRPEIEASLLQRLEAQGAASHQDAE
jgi:hypothetical protein